MDDDVEAAASAFVEASRALMGVSLRSIATAPIALTVPQHRLLVRITADGSRRVGELAADLGVDQSNASRLTTAFTVSIEARDGVTTGISAADRARTIAVAVNSESPREAIVTPGHVFPLMAREGGTLVRAGHTEAAVDIARLAGLPPVTIARAKAVLAKLEAGRAKTGGLAAGLDDLPLFAAMAEAVEEQCDAIRAEVEAIDVDALTPREALDVLYRLKALARE